MADFDVLIELIEELLLLVPVGIALPFEPEYSEFVFVFNGMLLDDDDCDDMSKAALSCETMVKFVEARG